jgi:hypothetical protein
MKNSRERKNEDFNFDDLLEHDIIKRSYRKIIVINDKLLNIMQNVKLILIMTLKIFFVTIFNWKYYIRLFFYVRKNIIKYDITRNTRDFVILHETHVYLNQICILNLNAKTMNQSSIVFHIRSKRNLRKKIFLNLIHQLIIDFNCSELHQYDFNQKLIKFYSILQHAYSFFPDFRLEFYSFFFWIINWSLIL